MSLKAGLLKKQMQNVVFRGAGFYVYWLVLLTSQVFLLLPAVQMQPNSQAVPLSCVCGSK